LQAFPFAVPRPLPEKIKNSEFGITATGVTATGILERIFFSSVEPSFFTSLAMSNDTRAPSALHFHSHQCIFAKMFWMTSTKEHL
jgi:hypothetical protein